ncbi:hypothetical protein ACP_1409 [Acidobacterium capsulatum ATCC 51196]|uniref:Uncharacterized protein n=1 Tax=Acidobacterium capsulatum (strain ATCC 51196 / DSM 11244 / BCRC 80197 / JCM 7670 / NBRC 15755 / NCIMB 13165 / 161) TaxID=240015 RepID=C1F600_ACIC5|nr:hypothetical protein ACP_1409 [Acidobacterium capsulatum ATCC 51196]
MGSDCALAPLSRSAHRRDAAARVTPLRIFCFLALRGLSARSPRLFLSFLSPTACFDSSPSPLVSVRRVSSPPQCFQSFQ